MWLETPAVIITVVIIALIAIVAFCLGRAYQGACFLARDLAEMDSVDDDWDLASLNGTPPPHHRGIRFVDSED